MVLFYMQILSRRRLERSAHRMIGSESIFSARGTLVASRLLLSAIVMPTDLGQERIDPSEIDRFSKIGLGKPTTVHVLANALCELDHNGPTDQFLSTIDEVLAKALEPELPIPSIGVDDLKMAHGHFAPSDWSIMLDQHLVTNRSNSKDDLVDLMDTLAHELRHADQYFAAANVEARHHRFRLYDFLPDTIKDRAKQNSNVEDDTYREFGEFIIMTHMNDEISEKKKYIDDKLEDPDISRDDYEYYVNVVRNKLPLERDAESMGRTLHNAIRECLEPR